MDTIHINPFRSNKDNHVRPMPTSWDTWVEYLLLEPMVVAEKQDAPLFNAVKYKTIDEIPPESSDWAVDYGTGESFVKRRKANIHEIDCLILDYDDGLTIDEAKIRFSAYEYVGYSSYNHLVKPGIQKFRLVFRLASPIPAWVKVDEYERPVEWGEWYHISAALKTFAGPCDPASFNANQIYYVPSVHLNNQHLAVVWHHQGEPLDWTTFDRGAPNRRQVSPSIPTTEKTVRQTDKTLHPNYTLNTERGPIRVGDVEGKIEGVLCPFHPDKKGSEFVKRVPTTGNVFLYCKKCGIVYMDRNPNFVAEFTESKKRKPPKVKERPTPHKIFTVDDLDLPKLEYPTWDARHQVLKELKKIGEKILWDTGFYPLGWSSPIFDSHILYLPEGSGKSRLAAEFAKRGEKIVFACKSWDQAFEKYEEFLKLGLQQGFTVQLFASKDGKARRRFGVKVVRGKSNHPYRTGPILDEETLQAFIDNNPNLNPDFIRLSWQFFSSDVLSLEAIPQPLFDDEGNPIDDGESGSYVGKNVNILVTTFAQVRILKLKNQHLPRDWIVWFDDPDITDVIDIDPYNPERQGELSEEELEKRTWEINGRRYFRRNEKESLGYAFRFHKCVYTTTEVLTRKAIGQLLARRQEQYQVHSKMKDIPGGNITILGTDKVRKRLDSIIPLVVRRLNKMKHPSALIANGLESELNHSNNKGQNHLAETNIIVELSIPHPAEIKTVVDALGLSYEKDRHWITKTLMLDRAHQAIGRNSGYRWDGYECVVLADKHIHHSLVSDTRYVIDKENSVLIDRLASMSRKDRRTTSTASPLVQDIEYLLNTLDDYLTDNRKAKPDIDHVVKAIEPEGKRSKYVCRLLIALTTLSGVRFDCNEDSTEVGDARQQMYRKLGDWVLKKWVPQEKWDSVWKEYRNTLGVSENKTE